MFHGLEQDQDQDRDQGQEQNQGQEQDKDQDRDQGQGQGSAVHHTGWTCTAEVGGETPAGGSQDIGPADSSEPRNPECDSCVGPKLPQLRPRPAAGFLLARGATQPSSHISLVGTVYCLYRRHSQGEVEM